MRARPTPDLLANQVAAYWTAHGQPVPGPGATAPPSGVDVPLGPLAWAVPAAAVWWAWRSGRLPGWTLERWGLALPWRGAERAARRRGRWRGRDWLVRGVLPDAFWHRPPWWPLVPARKRAYLAVLAGEEGSGKSYLLVYLAVCCVLGVDFLGLPTRRLGGVVYADSELDAGTFWQRVAAVVAGLGLPDPLRAHVRCVRGLSYVCLRDHGESLSVPADREREQGQRAAGMARIAALVRRRRAGLALVDGLTTGAGAAESDGQAAARMVLALEGLGCAVVAIDHTNASGQQAGSANKRRLERVKFLLRRVGKGRPDDGRRRLVLEKASFTGKDAELRYVQVFHDGADGELGAVTFTTLPVGPSSTVTTAPSPDPDTTSTTTPTTTPPPPAPPGGRHPDSPSPSPALPGQGHQPSSGQGQPGVRPRPVAPASTPAPARTCHPSSPEGDDGGARQGLGARAGPRGRATQEARLTGRKARSEAHYAERHRRAYEALGALLRARGAMTYAELAEATGWPAETVKNRAAEMKRLGLAGGGRGTTVSPP